MRIASHPLLLALCMGGLCASVEAAEPGPGMVNVLTLGVKNDGSEDISAIINENTVKSSLFFPAGIYKVANPITLRNPICGEGYARVPWANNRRTWLVSAIDNQDASVGVLNFSGNNAINVSHLNIKCFSKECGIRIVKCAQSTATFIEKVGIFNMRSYGLFVEGGGSRPIFAEDMTIFSSNDLPEPCVGIHIGPGVCDCRFNNIEAMGIRIGMEIFAGYTYCNNLHLWTGCMNQHDNGTWWRGTRGIVVGNGAFFMGSEIYPDTCFYALEQRGPSSSLDLHNIMYWEDGSVKTQTDMDGQFFHCTQGPGTLKINGGCIGIGARMDSYTPGQQITGVTLKSDYELNGANIKRLCLGNALPDYTLHYADEGFCKVVDIFTVAKTGACEGTLTLSDGAAYRLSCVKDATGKVETTLTPLNKLCDSHEVKIAEKPELQLLKVFVKSSGTEPWTARFVTTSMNDYFRPVDYANLRNKGGYERYREIEK